MALKYSSPYNLTQQPYDGVSPRPVTVSRSPESLKAAIIEMFQQKPLSVCCLEIERVATYCNIGHLIAVFPTILEHIFDFNNLPQSKWKMMYFMKKNLPSNDYVAIFNLLSTQGAIFKIIYRLLILEEPNIFTFTAHASFHHRNMILTNISPSYSAAADASESPASRNKLGLFHNGVLVNAFDFYMCHFGYCLVNPKRKRFDEWSQEGSMVYFSMAVSYWHHFLSLSSEYIPSIVDELKGFGVYAHDAVDTTHPGSPPLVQRTGSFHMPPEAVDRLIYQNNYSTNSKSPLLDMLMFQTPGVSPVTPDTGRRSPTISSFDMLHNTVLWRSESMLRIMCELWLQEYYLSTSNSIGPADESFAGSDIHRIVRHFIKHVHCFAFHCNKGNMAFDVDPVNNFEIGQSYDDRFKIHIVKLKQTMYLNILQPNIYRYLLRNLLYFPLDTSYRNVLETWLSYIQPWRYVDAATGYMFNEIRTVDVGWTHFVYSHLSFYTVLFQLVLQRLLSASINVELKALFIFRIARIMNLPNLPRMVREAEQNFLASSQHSVGFKDFSDLTSLSQVHVATCFRTSASEYTPLFTPATLSQMKENLSHIKFLYMELRQQHEVCDVKDGVADIFAPFTKLYRIIAGTSASNAGDTQVLQHLKEAHSSFCSTFGFVQENLDASYDTLLKHLRDEGWEEERGDQNLHSPSHAGSACNGSMTTSTPVKSSFTHPGATHSELQHCTQTLHIPQPRIDPELLPRRYWEVPVLLPLLYRITLALHQRFGVTFNLVYHGSGWLTMLTYPFLTAPPVRHTKVLGVTTTHDYPPRLSLRFLASMYTLSLLLVIIALCLYFDCSIFLIILISLLALIACRLYEYVVHCRCYLFDN